MHGIALPSMRFSQADDEDEPEAHVQAGARRLRQFVPTADWQEVHRSDREGNIEENISNIRLSLVLHI